MKQAKAASPPPVLLDSRRARLRGSPTALPRQARSATRSDPYKSSLYGFGGLPQPAGGVVRDEEVSSAHVGTHKVAASRPPVESEARSGDRSCRHLHVHG